MWLNEIIQPPPDPQANRWIDVTAWQVAVCGGNTCAAAILAYFFARHYQKQKHAADGRQDNDIAEAHGLQRRRGAESLWFRATDEQIEQAIFFYKRRSFPDALKVLEDAGFISVLRANPNPRFAFDKSRYFRLNPAAIQKRLRAIYDYKKDRQRENADSTPQTRGASRKTADNRTNNRTNSKDNDSDESLSAKGKKKGRRNRSPEIPLPDSLKELTPELIEIAEGVVKSAKDNPNNVQVNIAREHTKFLNHADQTERLSRGERGWRAAWRNWIVVAIERAENNGGGRGPHSPAAATEEIDEDDLERQVNEHRARQEGRK